MTLRGGLVVPLDVLQVVWRLEDRGCRFKVDDDELFFSPAGALDGQDRVFLREHRTVVCALIRSCGEVSA